MKPLYFAVLLIAVLGGGSYFRGYFFEAPAETRAPPRPAPAQTVAAATATEEAAPILVTAIGTVQSISTVIIPGKINFGSGGSGTSIHLAAELFKAMAGVEMQHVPYRGGGQFLTGLLGGEVQVIFDNLPSSIELIRAGKLRPLAVTMTTRSDVLPEIPTVADFVPGYEASAFFGIGAPRSTPREIIERLNGETNLALADPGMKARLADLGGVVLMGSPSDFGKLVADETEKWRKVIRAANIKAE
jgi:tripartite-type tricarboxylate transporter receptor subunit TctC